MVSVWQVNCLTQCMTALTQEVQQLPHLLKAVLLMICTTIALMGFVIAQPHRDFSDGVVLASSPSVRADAGVDEGKVSPFGPVVRKR
jgi:hypothetical protein